MKQTEPTIRESYIAMYNTRIYMHSESQYSEGKQKRLLLAYAMQYNQQEGPQSFIMR